MRQIQHKGYLFMKTKKGFTLVEILIVVVILGILAAIVIPQFSSASTEARVSSVQSNLQAVRSQIQLYKIQHNDQYPGEGGATFVEALTGKTDISGDVDENGAYGPYLQKFPANPFNSLKTVAEAAGTGSLGGGDTGWYFDTTEEQFYADVIEGVSDDQLVNY